MGKGKISRRRKEGVSKRGIRVKINKWGISRKTLNVCTIRYLMDVHLFLNRMNDCLLTIDVLFEVHIFIKVGLQLFSTLDF